MGAAPTPEQLVGQALGAYRLTEVLGTGGMGTVYRAEHTGTGRPAAVKTLLPEMVEQPELRRRFEREGETAGFLQHPHVVEVFEMGRAADGRLYLAMELVTGRSVGDLIDEGPLHPRRALVIARQTLLGLGYAHQHGLVHRDLKPDNIMVEAAGEPGREFDRVKLLDFGLVKILADAAGVFGWEKLTQTGVVFGTPQYMAPEQALGRAVDGRSDLYALGIILYEMLAGAPPFDSDDPVALLRMHVSQPPAPLAQATGRAPWCTDALSRLVERALVKRPTARYADARAMIAALDEAFVSLDDVA